MWGGGGGESSDAMLPVYHHHSSTHHGLMAELKGSPSPTSRHYSTAFLQRSRSSQGGRSLSVARLARVLMTMLLGASGYAMLLKLRELYVGGGSGVARYAGSGGGALAARLPPPVEQLRSLVLVAGHAVYTGVHYNEAAQEGSWFLEDYQKVPGEAQSFLDHIRLGIEAAAADPYAMLLFSGGQTRREAGPRSEGLSYWVVAEAAGWFGHPEVRNRTFTEEHARDSFENLLFSLCRYYELTGHAPDRVTVVSYTLKQRRFEGLHRAAVRFPASRFHFIGSTLPAAAKGAPEGEARTVEAFVRDPYGCSGDLLAKRLRRDPFAVGPPHPSRCPALQGLMSWCQRSPYPGKLPWSAPLSEVVRGEEEPEDDGTGGGALVAADELTIGGAAS